MATLNNDVFSNHTPLALGVLRNGAAANVVRTSRESSIPAKFYFTGVRYFDAIRGDTAARAPDCPAILIFEAQFRSALATIVEAQVASARAAHAAAAGAAAGAGGAGGPVAFDDAAARATARGSPTNRLEAIALGGVWTSLVSSFAIADGDLRGPEAGSAILTLVPPAPPANAARYATLMRTTMRGWTIGVVSGNAAGALTDAETTALNAAALSTAETEIAFACISLGQVAPVRAGAQIFEDGHHYHSNETANARHRACEKEVLARVGSDAGAIWKANVMLLRNAIWHAGIHPVNADILQGFAEDSAMTERLDATGYGSFSVGLPAQEDLFKRANAYLSVYIQVSQTAAAHGHRLDLGNLDAAVKALTDVGRSAGGGIGANSPALPGIPAAPWPTGCDTRTKVLKTFLLPYLDRAEPVAAWMFGFYREICSRAGIRPSTSEGSLLRSYSLKRAMAKYIGEANRASEMYSAYARFLRAQGEEGKFETYDGNA